MNATGLNHWLDVAFIWTWTTSLQASVLIVMVIAAQLLFGKWLKPRWRYALGFLVLIRLMLPWAPASSFSIFNLGSRPTTAAPWPTAPVVVLESERPVPALASDPEAVNSIIAPKSSPPTTDDWTITPRTAAKMTWLAGLVMFFGFAGWQHRRFSREVNGLEEIKETHLLRLLEEAKATMRIRRPVRLVKTDGLATPALFGLRKPCLLIPEALLRRLDEQEWRLVFLHELAHLRRGDLLLNWLMIAVRALHWFNPLVWLALRRLRSDRELLCDAMVLNHLDATERRTYGNTLIKLVEGFSQSRLCPTLVPALSHKHEIKRRVMMIAAHQPTSRTALGLSAALVVSLCCFTFTRAAEKKIEPASGQSSEREALKEPTAKAQKEEVVGPAETLAAAPAAEYQLRQDAEAVKKLEGIRKLRGDSNEWEEVSRLLQGVLASDTSKDIKRDIKRMALLELAGGSERNGQLAQAMQFLTEYAQRYETDTIIPEVFLRQGFLYRKMGEYDQAVAKFYEVMSSALRLKGNLAYYARIVLTAQSEIAETLYMQGKFSAAVEKYQKLLSVKEEGEELNRAAIQTKLIRCLAKLNNHSEVVKQSSDYLSPSGNSANQAEVRYLLATSYKAMGEKQRALQQLLLLLEEAENAGPEQAAQWKSWQMLAGNEIGNQLSLDGDFEKKARRVLAALAASGPSGPSAGNGNVTDQRNLKIPVPLTRSMVAFVKGDPEKNHNYDRIVALNAKAEIQDVAQPDKIVVNLSNSGRSTFAVARLSLLSEAENFIERVNEKRERLLDAASGVLSSKTLEEVEKPGFKNRLRAELLALFNEVLGAGAIQELFLTDFATQR